MFAVLFALTIESLSVLDKLRQREKYNQYEYQIEKQDGEKMRVTAKKQKVNWEKAHNKL